MHRKTLALGLCCCLCGSLAARLRGEQNEKDLLAEYRTAALNGGDPARGKTVFESNEAGCKKCHVFEGDERRAGPDLRVVGDKFGREQLIQSVLEPSATI